MEKIKAVRRYDMRYQGEWAVVLLTVDGIFSVVSTYGNYGYFWSHTGCDDVREFFLRMSRSKDYFIGKLNPKQVFDEERTLAALKAYFADDENILVLLEEAPGFMDANDLSHWLDSVSIEHSPEMHECFRQKQDPQTVALVDLLIQKWLPMLKKELEVEPNFVK